MLRKIQQIFSTLVLIATAFATGCSDYTAKVGDKISGSGNASVDSNGFVRGDGFLTLTRSNGSSSSVTRDDDDDDRRRRTSRGDRDGDDEDDDRDEREGRGKKIKMNNSTDKLVCTSSTGVVTVRKFGDKVQRNSHTHETCQVMTDTQAAAAASSSNSSSGSSSSSSSSTSTISSNSTSSSTGTNSSTSSGGTNSNNQGANTASSTSGNPALSF